MVGTRSKSRTNGVSDTNGNGVTAKSNGSVGNGNASKPQKAVGEETQNSVLFSILLPLALLLITPNFVMWIWYTVKFHNGCYSDFIAAMLDSPSKLQFLANIWSPANVTIGSQFSILVIGGYMLFQIVLMVLVPGPRAEGPPTPNGNIPVYKDNGFRIFLITMATFVGLTYYLKTYTPYSPSMVHDNFGDILATLNVFAALFCVILYLKGIFAPSSSDSGSTGNPIMDYYWGTELYPRIFGIDIKVGESSEGLHKQT